MSSNWEHTQRKRLVIPMGRGVTKVLKKARWFGKSGPGEFDLKDEGSYEHSFAIDDYESKTLLEANTRNTFQELVKELNVGNINCFGASNDGWKVEKGRQMDAT